MLPYNCYTTTLLLYPATPPHLCTITLPLHYSTTAALIRSELYATMQALKAYVTSAKEVSLAQTEPLNDRTVCKPFHGSWTAVQRSTCVLQSYIPLAPPTLLSSERKQALLNSQHCKLVRIITRLHGVRSEARQLANVSATHSTFSIMCVETSSDRAFSLETLRGLQRIQKQPLGQVNRNTTHISYSLTFFRHQGL